MCHQAQGPDLDSKCLGSEILSIDRFLRALCGAVGDGDVHCQVQENGTTPACFMGGGKEAMRPWCFKKQLSPHRPQWQRQQP